MVVMQACKLNLPPHSRPSLEVTSILFEPFSNTLALMQSDSSILLLPSLYPFSLTPSSSPQTLIPPVSTSSTFVRLQSTPNSPTNRILFVVAGPRHGDSRVVLRFWILQNSRLFVKAKVSCSHRGFLCDDRLGVSVDLTHGASVKVVGSVNVFALHSVSARKIWVLAAKMVRDEEGEESVCVKLMKCAVIDCTIPICSITVSVGFLLLGEENGVRVFPLRPILKGRAKKQRGSTSWKKEKKNGCASCDKNCVCGTHSRYIENCHIGKSVGMKEPAAISSNGYTGKAEKNNDPLKPSTVKLKQDSSVGGTFLVAFSNLEVPCKASSTKPLFSLKMVSIHYLSQKKFLVLDSDGDLHLLSLYSVASDSEVTGHMKCLSHTMKVRMLAVLPDISTKTQTFWVSDGSYSVHVMSISNVEVALNENGKSESEENQVQISATQALFASEKIQDLIPLSRNAVFILGQGSNADLIKHSALEGGGHCGDRCSPEKLLLRLGSDCVVLKYIGFFVFMGYNFLVALLPLISETIYLEIFFFM